MKQGVHLNKVKVGGDRHRGNKAALPSKACVACGRPMSWRKCWAKNWAEVKYCSDACRRLRTGVV